LCLETYAVPTGIFLLNNYRQALRIVQDDGADLKSLEARLGTSADDYARYLREEKAYLEGLKSEPEDVALRLDYLEALQDLEDAQYVFCTECAIIDD
jgi:hypothetical protein